MAKRAKAKTGTRKPAKNTTSKVFTAEDILADWKQAVQAGLGPKKRLSAATVTAFEPKLLAAIRTRIKKGGDYAKEGRNTRAVARVVGRFCATLVLGNEIPKAVFEDVFKACQHHHLCPTTTSSGSGKWCEI